MVIGNFARHTAHHAHHRNFLFLILAFAKSAPIERVWWRPAFDYCLVACADGSLSVWELSTGRRESCCLNEPIDEITAGAGMSIDFRYVFAAQISFFSEPFFTIVKSIFLSFLIINQYFSFSITFLNYFSITSLINCFVKINYLSNCFSITVILIDLLWRAAERRAPLPVAENRANARQIVYPVGLRFERADAPLVIVNSRSKRVSTLLITADVCACVHCENIG